MKKIKLILNLDVEILKQQKRFIAYSPALDICTSAKSEKEVRSRFVEMTDIFLDELAKMRTKYRK
jgi:hypothetical protein